MNVTWKSIQFFKKKPEYFWIEMTQMSEWNHSNLSFEICYSLGKSSNRFYKITLRMSLLLSFIIIILVCIKNSNASISYPRIGMNHNVWLMNFLITTRGCVLNGYFMSPSDDSSYNCDVERWTCWFKTIIFNSYSLVSVSSDDT